jgi:hypothetical protein
MLKCIFGEFSMILSLFEILFPKLCLALIINVCSKIDEGYRCVDWLFRLVLDQSMCGIKFACIPVIFIFICNIPLYAN